MKQIGVCLIAGLLFGIGLALSSMIDPNKVLNFLDVSGNWDPSLIFVMVGALSVTLIAFRYIPKRKMPLFDNTFKLPSHTEVDKPLILGAIIFGIGWGTVGFCPGPAISSAGLGLKEPIIFVISMLIGFSVQRFIYEKK